MPTQTASDSLGLEAEMGDHKDRERSIAEHSNHDPDILIDKLQRHGDSLQNFWIGSKGLAVNRTKRSRHDDVAI